jgi:hypothetical protein
MRVWAMVGLYREKTIETLPIDEVRADLARLGVDPAPLVTLARRLADGSIANPAVALLRQLEQAEAIDAEIAALEQAPIARVLTSLEAGRSAPAPVQADARASGAAAPESPQAGGGPVRETMAAMSVLPFRSRRALLGWGGSLAGIAACLLLFFAVRPDDLELADRSRSQQAPAASLALDDYGEPVPAPAARAGADQVLGQAALEADALSAPPPPAEPGRAAPLPPADLARSEPGKTSASADAEGAVLVPVPRPAQVRASAAGGQSEEGESAVLAESSVHPQSRAQVTPPGEPLPLAGSAREQAQAALAALQAASVLAHLPVPKPALPEAAAAHVQASALPATAAALAPAPEIDRPGASPLPADTITGVYVVDVDRVPPELVLLELDKRDGRLAARLAEASRRAPGRKVLALIAFEDDGRQVEAALVATDAAGRSGADQGFELLTLSDQP